MSSSLQKMRESMKSKKTLFGSSKGKEVEALRDNLEQVGAQKVLHEQLRCTVLACWPTAQAEARCLM